jgi:hypothetical protein
LEKKEKKEEEDKTPHIFFETEDFFRNAKKKNPQTNRSQDTTRMNSLKLGKLLEMRFDIFFGNTLLCVTVSFLFVMVQAVRMGTNNTRAAWFALSYRSA